MYKILTLRLTPKTSKIVNNHLNIKIIISIKICFFMVKNLHNSSAVRFLKELHL